MHLTVTVRMDQREIVRQVLASVHAPPPVVNLPAALRQQWFPTDRAFPSLAVPEALNPRPTHGGRRHPLSDTLLEVRLPGGLVRVGLPADLDVTPDGCLTGLCEILA